jgi:ABC-2 type transport system permease protein
MAMITDLDRHVVDRFLATPASRLAIVLSQVVRAGVIALTQAVVILLVGFALGVHVHGGALGVVVLFAAAALVAMVFAGISNGIALLVRREATMIAAANFVGLPLMFLSSILITQRVMPHWMQVVSRFNPVNWAVRAARDAVVRGGNWGSVGVHLLLLVGVTLVTASFATWTFRSYQRTL